MRRIILTLLICITTITVSAQSGDVPYKGIETSQEIQLSQEQIAKIKKIRIEAGSKFEAIGSDNSLSGHEKGRKKRELARKLKKDINNVLTPVQLSAWEKKHGKLDNDESFLDIIGDEYEKKLDALEEKYDREKDAIDDNDSLTKNEKKRQKKALKEKYKADKERLKSEKERAKKLN